MTKEKPSNSEKVAIRAVKENSLVEIASWIVSWMTAPNFGGQARDKNPGGQAHDKNPGGQAHEKNPGGQGHDKK